MLRAAFDPLREQSGSAAATPEDFWKQVQEQGGWWSAAVTPAAAGPAHTPDETPERRRGRHQRKKSPPHPAQTAPPPAPVTANLVFDGGEHEYPFNFLPYASQMLGDGSLAHLPWMQETPDPLSTAMWCAWVEINPKTAERLGIRQGDLVEIASQHGKVQAPALVSPGIAPDVVAMPVGQGHENFGRYASRRGANPLQILAPMVESETGAFAWAATRVKIARVGPGKLVLFAGGMREKPFEGAPR
jgi:anaerobic selenocysteine-containing dehydrogenase